MTPFETVLIIYGAILSLTTLTVVYRMVVGPTILDRAVSTDSLLVLMVLGMALYSAHALENWAGPAMLSMTGLAFIGTVTFARFVAREDRPRGHRGSRDQEPETSTGPLDAIHFDNGQDNDEQWPANVVAPTTVPDGEVDGRELGAHEELPADTGPPVEEVPASEGESPVEQERTTGGPSNSAQPRAVDRDRIGAEDGQPDRGTEEQR